MNVLARGVAPGPSDQGAVFARGAPPPNPCRRPGPAYGRPSHPARPSAGPPGAPCRLLGPASGRPSHPAYAGHRPTALSAVATPLAVCSGRPRPALATGTGRGNDAEACSFPAELAAPAVRGKYSPWRLTVAIRWNPSRGATLGIEWELQLIDCRSRMLRQDAREVLAALPALSEVGENQKIRYELMQSTV